MIKQEKGFYSDHQTAIPSGQDLVTFEWVSSEGKLRRCTSSAENLGKIIEVGERLIKENEECKP